MDNKTNTTEVIWSLSYMFLVLKLVWNYVCMWQLRRERIAERMKALQELVPNANKVGNHVYHYNPSMLYCVRE